MNFIKKIFKGEKEMDRKIFEEKLKNLHFSEEEIIRFKIVRLEVLIAEGKEILKEFLRKKNRKK